MSGLREEVVGGDCLDPWPPLLIKQYASFIFWFIYLFSGTEGAGSDVRLEGGGGVRGLPGPLASFTYKTIPLVYFLVYLSFFLSQRVLELTSGLREEVMGGV